MRRKKVDGGNCLQLASLMNKGMHIIIIMGVFVSVFGNDQSSFR